MGIFPLKLQARGKSHIFKGCFLWLHGSNRNPKGTTYLSRMIDTNFKEFKQATTTTLPRLDVL